MRLLGLTQQIPETGVLSRLEPRRDSYGLEHNPGADRAGSPEASLDSQVGASPCVLTVFSCVGLSLSNYPLS